MRTTFGRRPSSWEYFRRGSAAAERLTDPGGLFQAEWHPQPPTPRHSVVMALVSSPGDQGFSLGTYVLISLAPAPRAARRGYWPPEAIRLPRRRSGLEAKRENDTFTIRQWEFSGTTLVDTIASAQDLRVAFQEYVRQYPNRRMTPSPPASSTSTCRRTETLPSPPDILTFSLHNPVLPRYGHCYSAASQPVKPEEGSVLPLVLRASAKQMGLGVYQFGGINALELWMRLSRLRGEEP
jgi:hypothetical protein